MSVPRQGSLIRVGRPMLLALMVSCVAVSVASTTELARAKIGRETCRRVCAVAIEQCLQLESAALNEAGLSNKRLRRQTRKARRGCQRKAYRRCKHEGMSACGTPLSCECSG